MWRPAKKKNEKKRRKSLDSWKNVDIKAQDAKTREIKSLCSHKKKYGRKGKGGRGWGEDLRGGEGNVVTNSNPARKTWGTRGDDGGFGGSVPRLRRPKAQKVTRKNGFPIKSIDKQRCGEEKNVGGKKRGLHFKMRKGMGTTTANGK